MSYNYDTLKVEQEKYIAHVQFNRPETMNALEQGLIDDIHNCFCRLAADKEVRVIILSGVGRAFCAGGDISFLKIINSKSHIEIRSFLVELFNKLTIVSTIEKPVIGALHGFVMGAGFSLSLLCDMRLAAQTTTFGAEFPQMGLIPEVGCTYNLPSLVGLGKAMELIITARRFKADEAEQIGIVNKVVADEDLISETMSLARQIASLPPLAVGLGKAAIRRGAIGSFDESIAHEATINAFCYKTEDHKEATSAFFEKRKPVIKGC